MWTELLIEGITTTAKHLDFSSFAGDLVQSHTPEQIREALAALRHNFDWGKGLEAYREHLRKEELAVHFFGVNPEQVPVTEFYIEVDVCPQRMNSYHCKEPRRLGITLLDSNRRDKVLAPQPRYYILGKAGSGKTSLLKFIGWKSMESEKGGYLPFFITLHRLAEELALSEEGKKAKVKDFITYLAQKVKPWFMDHTPGDIDPELFFEIWVETALRSGKALLLLDGLDEVPSSNGRKQIRRLAQKLSQAYPYTRIVVSSRPPAVPLGDYKRYIIAPFREEQIWDYIEKWFHQFLKKSKEEGGEVQEESASGEKYIQTKIKGLWEELDKEQDFVELARTPLMLNLLCITYDTFGELERRRVDLYQQATDALLEVWRTSRGVPPPRDLEGRVLSRSFKESLFKEIAYWALEQNLSEIPREQIVPILQEALQRWFEEEKFQGEKGARTSETLLENLERNYGLLLQVSPRRYAFFHRGFQEFYAAAYLKDRGSTLWQEIFEHLGAPSWDATFSMLVQMIPYSDVVTELYNYLGGVLKDALGDEVRKIGDFLSPFVASGGQALQVWHWFLEAEAWRLAKVSQILTELEKTEGASRRSLIEKYHVLWPTPDEMVVSILEASKEEIAANESEWQEWVWQQTDLINRGANIVATGKGALETLIESYTLEDAEAPNLLMERLDATRTTWERHQVLPPGAPYWHFLLDELAFSDLEEFLQKVYPLLDGLHSALLKAEERDAFLKTLLLGK